MQLLVPLERVGVVRKGKRVTPKLGKPFPFTDAEADELAEVRPEAVRKAIVEADAALDLPEEDDSVTDDEIETVNAEEAKKAKAKRVEKKITTAAGLKKGDLNPPPADDDL